ILAEPGFDPTIDPLPVGLNKGASVPWLPILFVLICGGVFVSAVPSLFHLGAKPAPTATITSTPTTTATVTASASPTASWTPIPSRTPYGTPYGAVARPGGPTSTPRPVLAFVTVVYLTAPPAVTVITRSGGGGGGAPAPTYTPYPPQVPLPTYTPRPTYTPYPA